MRDVSVHQRGIASEAVEDHEVWWLKVENPKLRQMLRRGVAATANVLKMPRRHSGAGRSGLGPRSHHGAVSPYRVGWSNTSGESVAAEHRDRRLDGDGNRNIN